MTALTESKQALKTKIIKSGKYPGKAWNRIQIIQEKIKKREPFKLGASGSGQDVYGISYDVEKDQFSKFKL